jgi:hypothetical protein
MLWFHKPTRKASTLMSPNLILQLALPIIEALPSLASSFEALLTAVETMCKRGATLDQAMSTVKAAASQVTAAVIANTPSAPTPPATSTQEPTNA